MAGKTEQELTSDPQMEEPMSDAEMELAAAAAQTWVATAGVTGANQ
jgi:hypothetical protein